MFQKLVIGSPKRIGVLRYRCPPVVGLLQADYDYVCPDVYVNGSEDGGEDGYICLP